MRRPLPPPLDPARLERIRSRVLVTVAAGSIAAVGCDHTPEHTLNRPAVVHPPSQEAVNRPIDPPRVVAPEAGAAHEGTINTPFRPPEADAAAPAPVVRNPLENIPFPLSTNSPPRPRTPRPFNPPPMPVGNPPGPQRPVMPPGNG